MRCHRLVVPSFTFTREESFSDECVRTRKIGDRVGETRKPRKNAIPQINSARVAPADPLRSFREPSLLRAQLSAVPKGHVRSGHPVHPQKTKRDWCAEVASSSHELQRACENRCLQGRGRRDERAWGSGRRSASQGTTDEKMKKRPVGHASRTQAMAITSLLPRVVSLEG